MEQMKLSRREFLWTNMKLALGAATASLVTGNPKGVMADEMKGKYTIREGTFQHIVLEGTSYKIGKMQGEIIKETDDIYPAFPGASEPEDGARRFLNVGYGARALERIV
jgi:hypothetical protein